MNEQLDYAEMLEIPVSTVNVTKKKSIFKRKNKQKEAATDGEELKDLVVDSVNERVGAYVYAEDLSEPVAPQKKPVVDLGGKGGVVLIAETAAAFALALGIFLTNVFMPNSVINTFITSFGADRAEPEPTYNEITLTSPVSDFSDAEVTAASNGVLSFQAEGCVYPVCEGSIGNISQENGAYTVQINHTSTFSSVITGLTNVYAEVGEKVEANIPFAYSDGSAAVSVSMYDGETLLNGYTLNDEIPVWNT